MLCEWCFVVGLLWESGVVVQVFMQQQQAGLLAHANKRARAEEEEEEIETENIYGDNDPKLLLLILLSSSSSLQFLASILLRGPNPRSPVVSMSSSVTRISSSPPSPDSGEFANSTTISTSTLEHFGLRFVFSVWREREREREREKGHTNFCGFCIVSCW
jgi:hypothetical protein